MVNRLLDCKDINVNLQNREKKTALYWTAKYNHPEITSLLLKRKDININLQIKDGQTALSMALNKGYLDVVNHLLGFQNEQIREGFELLKSHGSLYVPNDLIELIIEFIEEVRFV